jgi:hypothetical protein
MNVRDSVVIVVKHEATGSRFSVKVWLCRETMLANFCFSRIALSRPVCRGPLLRPIDG